MSFHNLIAQSRNDKAGKKTSTRIFIEPAGWANRAGQTGLGKPGWASRQAVGGGYLTSC